MNQMTVFGDIHGNLPALTAVYNHMNTHNHDRRFCLGDLVGYGAAPNEVVDFIRAHDVPTLMGNYDQGVGYDSDDCGCAYKTPEAQALGKRSITWTNAHVTADHKAYLRNLPMSMIVLLGKLRVALVHGSPRRINEYLYADRPEASLARLLDLAGADVLVCGHTHLPYHRILSDGRHMINAGSVGKPKDSNPQACYVVLTAATTDLTVEFIRVPYDIEQAAQAIEAATLPHEFAQMLRQGSG